MTVEIHLPSGHVALIDDADVHVMTGRRWYAQIRPGQPTYVRGQRCGGDAFVLLHKPIMGAGRVDHKDGNGLNNTRVNLRNCTHAENMRNSKPRGERKYKGVIREGTGRIRASIMADRKVIRSSAMPSEEAAARWYDEKARVLHGEFARLNFPIDSETDVGVDVGYLLGSCLGSEE